MRTHAREGAPGRSPGWPAAGGVVLAGAGDPRTWGTGLVEELASRGYVVITIDHTHEAPGVWFPDGTVTDNEPVLDAFAEAVENGTVPTLLEKMLRTRIDDARVVVDRLGELPLGLSSVVDPRRVGMFGQSAGGITAASTMFEDRRLGRASTWTAPWSSTRSRTGRTSCRWRDTGWTGRSC